MSKFQQKHQKKNGVLKDNIAVLNDINVKVLETKSLPKGTCEFQEKDQLIITYEVTNKADKEIDPINGWLAAFEAYQEDEMLLENYKLVLYQIWMNTNMF